MNFKFWLRGPADDPQVELIGEHGWYWHSGHFSQRADRSIMAEMLTPDEVRRLEASEGRWLLPGPPP